MNRRHEIKKMNEGGITERKPVWEYRMNESTDVKVNLDPSL